MIDINVSDPIKPFLPDSIEFLVQPPGDQIRLIDQCSGGEKALIRICVLYAIAQVKQWKLLIFDEADQNLD